MPSREELNQLYSDSHKLKQVIADNNALRKQLAQQAEMVEQCMVCMNDNADEAKRLESVIVELQAALAEPSEAVAWTESAIDEYLSGYSLIGDDGDYTPTDDEKFVIKDAIIGFMSATPDCWDTAAYPALEDAIIEAKAWEHCTNEDCAHPATSKPAPLPELTREELLGAIARGWCTERNAYKTMDVELAEDIAEAVWEKLE